MDDYQIAELLSGRRPLLAYEGFWGDEAAIRQAWQEHETGLLQLWRERWQPPKFADWVEPEGRRLVYPPGWRKFCGHFGSVHAK
jgi:hypothetical protein